MSNLAKVKEFFPSGKSRWIKYTLTSLPIIFSAMVFALNSFVDNFMAINISGGNQALSYSNTWTGIVTGIVTSTTVVGSSLFGQYWGMEDRVRIREVVRARMLIATSIALLFAIPNLIAPETMIKLASGFDKKLNQEIINKATEYNRIIAISWILSAWSYTQVMILRESGFGRISLVSSLISLFTNIIFNTIFIFGLKLGIAFLAYSTIISLIIPITFLTIYIWKYNKKVIVNPLKIFDVSKTIWLQIWKRSASFFLFAISSITVSIRFIFWNIGYPTGSVGNNEDYNLSAGVILGISGMFFNIFWTTFESINANIAIFVGWELGNNNIKQAKINAKELQGFHLFVSLIIGITLFALSFGIGKLNFLTDGYIQQLRETLEENKTPEEINQIIPLARKEFLVNLKHTIWPLSWYMPFWIWYITKGRIISVGGGMTNVISLVDAINGIVQTCWIVLINYVIAKHSSIEFPWAYTLFFLSDLLKIPVFETLYYKLEWAKNITSEVEEPKSLV